MDFLQGPDVKSCVVDMAHALRLRRELVSYTTMRTCVDMLAKYVVSSTLSNVPGEQDVWSAFVVDVLKDAVSYGVSVATVHKGHPRTLPWTEFKLRVTYNHRTHHKSYEVLPHTSITPMRNVVVLDCFDAGIGVDGAFNSLCSTALFKIDIMQRMLDITVRGSSNAAQPPVLTEYQDKTPAQSVQYGLYADAQQNHINAENAFEHDQSALARLRAQTDALRAQAQQVGVQDGGVGLRGRDTCADTLNVMRSVAQMPEGVRVAAHPRYTSPVNSIVDIQRYFEAETFVLMGVPRNLVHNDSIRAGSNTQLMDQFLMTVKWWQLRVARAMTLLNELTRAPKKRRRRPVEFSTTSYQFDVDTLLRLQPLLSEAGFAKIMQMQFGLEPSDLAPPETQASPEQDKRKEKKRKTSA